MVIQDVDFLTQVLDSVKSMGGLPFVGKMSVIVMLLISSMKVTFLRPYWDKMGATKPWMSPLLSMLVGLLGLLSTGTMPTLVQLSAYMLAGAGALHLHELLELAKKIPKIGPVYVKLIDMLEGVLNNMGVGR